MLRQLLRRSARCATTAHSLRRASQSARRAVLQKASTIANQPQPLWLVAALTAVASAASIAEQPQQPRRSTPPPPSSPAQRQAESKAQELYSANPLSVYDYIHSFLDEGNAPTADLLWRLARACHDQAMESQDHARKKALTIEGFEAAQKALELDDSIAGVHKWMAIMYSDLGDFTSVKEKLLNAFKMRDHFVRATELDPTDATARHLLGVWCFTFADMPWYQRKAAATLFATPPTSTYEECLQHFQAAEEIDPGFYTKNALYLGKTLLRMGRKDEGRQWLQKCLAMPANNTDDRQAHVEAKQLLGRFRAIVL